MSIKGLHKGIKAAGYFPASNSLRRPEWWAANEDGILLLCWKDQTKMGRGGKGVTLVLHRDPIHYEKNSQYASMELVLNLLIEKEEPCELLLQNRKPLTGYGYNERSKYESTIGIVYSAKVRKESDAYHADITFNRRIS